MGYNDAMEAGGAADMASADAAIHGTAAHHRSALAAHTRAAALHREYVADLHTRGMAAATTSHERMAAHHEREARRSANSATMAGAHEAHAATSRAAGHAPAGTGFEGPDYKPAGLTPGAMKSPRAAANEARRMMKAHRAQTAAAAAPAHHTLQHGAKGGSYYLSPTGQKVYVGKGPHGHK
jgi:hypothetical protein